MKGESNGSKPKGKPALSHPIYDGEYEGPRTETSHLLGNTSNSSIDSIEEPEDGNESTWPGAKDFEGLPWWRKPSVCLLL
jgi:hypothetical protein